jgi:hypothetical protein
MCDTCHGTGIAPLFGEQPEEVCGCVDAWAKEKLQNGIWSDLQEEGEFGPALQAAFAAAMPCGAAYEPKEDRVSIAGWFDIYPKPTMPLRWLMEEVGITIAVTEFVERQP